MEKVATGIIILFGLGFFLLLFGIKWETSEDLVSGIVYDNANNKIVTGKSTFKVRASAEMYAGKDTSRTYCLPKDSPYIPLVKEAAADKNIKIVVKTSKNFQIMWPMSCPSNVVVEKLDVSKL